MIRSIYTRPLYQRVIYCAALVFLGWLCGTVCKQCLAAPYEQESYKLAHVAEVIKDPAGCRMVIIGDSTAAVYDSPRWGESITREWDLPFAGRTFYRAQSTALSNGFIHFSASSTASEGDSLDGITVPPGFAAAYRTWGSDSNFGSMYRSHGNLANYKQGHPLAGEDYRCHWAMLGTNNPIAKAYLKYADSGNNIEVDYSSYTFGVVADGTWQKITFPTYTGDTTDRTSLGVAPTTQLSYDESGTYQVVGGWSWEAVGKAGMHLSEIAVGGHTAHDHQPVTLNPSSKYSDAERKTKFDLFGWPNVIMVQLGINDAVNIRTTFKTQIASILDWHVSLYAANGHPAPKFLLVVPWDTDGSSGGATKRDNIAHVHTELADERTDCGVINLYRRMTAVHGHYDNWHSTYLADTIHQSTEGAVEFGKQSWALLTGEATPTYEELVDEAPGVYMMQDSSASTAIVNENGAAATLHGAGDTLDSSVQGPTTWLPKAIHVDGSNDYIDCGNHGVSADGVFTFAIWYRSSSSAVSYAMNEASSAANPPLVGLRLGNSQTRSWTRNDSNTGSYATGGETADGQWHFVVQSCDGNTNRLYIDGVFADDLSMPSAPFSVNRSMVGALGHASASNFFEGDVAGAIFSNRAWTYQNIQTVMAGPVSASAAGREIERAIDRSIDRGTNRR